MSNEKRKSGFYWVEQDGEMIVARYYGEGMSDAWIVPGDEFTYNDGYFDKIIENQLCYE